MEIERAMEKEIDFGPLKEDIGPPKIQMLEGFLYINVVHAMKIKGDKDTDTFVKLDFPFKSKSLQTKTRYNTTDPMYKQLLV